MVFFLVKTWAIVWYIPALLGFI